MASNSFLVILSKATGLRAADAGFLGKSDSYCVITSPTAPAVLNEKTAVIMVSRHTKAQ